MSNQFQPLFNPFIHPKILLKNRLVMAPMTRNQSPNFIPDDKVATYYRKRAEGNVGLIITEGTTVNHKAANGYPQVPAFHGAAAISGWKMVVDAVHSAEGKIIPQLWHVGAVRKPGVVGPDLQVPGFGPSGLVSPGKKRAHTMTTSDINEVIDAFAEGAKTAFDIGFDGIEIHGAHGYLIDQFFWAGTNEREDDYGGSLENRTKFAVKIIKACRAATHSEFLISLRFSQWKQQDYNARLVDTPAELLAFLTPLKDAGVDIFHASTRRFWEPEFDGSTLNLAGWAKKLTGLPSITVGSIGLDIEFTGNNIEWGSNCKPAKLDGLIERMEKQEFDLFAVGRALLMDSQWGQKVHDGRLDELLPFNKDALISLG